MIQFDKFTLDNGLKVLVHTDNASPLVAMSILYDVGARDENPEQTGFAHLFEHLMFGGSINIPEYDEPLQMAGGENNAYTTNDITNYYLSLPKENLETAFWLESDRMLSLAFSKKSLDVQRKVVCEEFKEHYINKPYGDVWELFRKMAFTKHPYQWQTIGKELKHVEDAQLQDVKNFFTKHYNPQNAVMALAGNVTVAEAKALAQKWFGPIPAGEKYNRSLPIEPKQTAPRKTVVYKDVPVNALYMAWPIQGRMHPSYNAMDIITEILGGGASSRLHVQLVKEQQIFSAINCYHFGSIDPALLVIEGKLVEGITMQQAQDAVHKVVENFCTNTLEENELQKTKNRMEAMICFEDMSILNRANNLTFYELLGDANGINTEWDKYNAVTTTQVIEVANTIFTPEQLNVLWYCTKQMEPAH
jgi:predicted Zn-dependent peptidase